VIEDVHGVPVLICPAEGEPLRSDREALDVIGEAFHLGARWVVVPASRCEDDFFRLRTRIAGDIVQKFVNYRLGLVVLGDISRHTAASESLRDFVSETNRGTQTWFLPDLPAFRTRLAPRQ